MQAVTLNHLINLYSLHFYEFKTKRTKGPRNAVSKNAVIDTNKAVLSVYIIIKVISLATCFPYQRQAKVLLQRKSSLKGKEHGGST